MDTYISLGISLGLIFLLLVLLSSKKKKKNINKKINYSNFKKIPLLTKKELQQYHLLKAITDDLDLIIFTKVRVADLISVKDGNLGDFNRIKAKHIDFVICNERLKVVCALEIDDSTHQRPDRIERDIFINTLFKSCKIPLIRSYNLKYDNVKKQISDIIG